MHNPVYLYCGVAEKCWPCISVTMESKSVYKVMFLRDFSSLHTQYSSTLSNKIQCYNEARKPFSEKSFIYLVYFNEKHSDQRKIFCVVKKKRRRRGGPLFAMPSSREMFTCTTLLYSAWIDFFLLS